MAFATSRRRISPNRCNATVSIATVTSTSVWLVVSLVVSLLFATQSVDARVTGNYSKTDQYQYQYQQQYKNLHNKQQHEHPARRLKPKRKRNNNNSNKRWQSITCVPYKINYEAYKDPEHLAGVIEIPDQWECDMFDDDEFGNSNTYAFATETIRSKNLDYTEFLEEKHGVSSYGNRVTFERARISNRVDGRRSVLEIKKNGKVTVEELLETQELGVRRMAEEIHTILVIRVNDIDNHAPIETQQQLSESIFGGPSDSVGLKTQLKACSGGRLQYEKVPDNSTLNTTGGVVDLYVPFSVDDYGPYTPYDKTDMDRKQLEKDVIQSLALLYPGWKTCQYRFVGRK